MAQNDTLVGVLRDISDKIIKRYPVTLGSQNPITVKTNKHGVFTIPGANLNDTLFVTIKKTRNIVKVPVNGYNYITITLENSTFNAKRSFEPDEALKEIMERERNKIVSSSVMNKEEIQKTGCRDLYCLLRRMSGITFADGSVRIRASVSLNSPSDPLVVVDGIPMDLSVLNTIPVEDVSELKVLKDAGLTPDDIDLITTDIGPGSFTGIRACTTVARVLAQQLNIKAAGVSSLEILSKILGGNDLAALDARKNKAYVYDGKILGAIELETVDELVKGRRVITDDSLKERLSEFASEVVSYQQGEYPIGEILAKLGAEKEETDWRKLKPLYIQPPPVTLKKL